METRLFCDWRSYPHFGMLAYRIWEKVDGPVIMQAHEWMRQDGTLEPLKWIYSCRR